MSSIVTTGALFKRFYQDRSVWNPSAQESFYIEDTDLSVDGCADEAILAQKYQHDWFSLPDEARVEIRGGYLVWDGSGPTPAQTEIELTVRFTAWERDQASYRVVAVFDVPKNSSPESMVRLHQALLQLGGQVEGLPDLTPAPGPAMARPRP